MKKLLFAVILLVSCQSKYKYVERVNDPDLIGSGFTEKEKEPKSIEAPNDIEAYSLAYEQFCISKKVYKDMAESGHAGSLAIPKSFRILNDKDQDISSTIDFIIKDSIEKKLDSTIDKIHTGIKERLNKNDNTDTGTSTEKSPVMVLSAKPVEQEYSNYKDIRLTWKNISGKTISAIKFRWTGINAFGEPADMGISSDGSGGGFSDDRLKAGKSQSGTWTLLSRDLKKVTKAWAYEVVFADGTKWQSDK